MPPHCTGNGVCPVLPVPSAPAAERFCTAEWDIWSRATTQVWTDGSAECNIETPQHTMSPLEASIYAELGVHRHDEVEHFEVDIAERED